MILQFFERFMLSVSLRTMKVLMTAVSHAVRCALCVEHGFYQMSEWMCGPGVTPLFICAPESMSNYPIIRLSVMYEDVAVFDLIVILRLIERLVVISITSGSCVHG